MLRKDWKFEYQGNQLLDAAIKKRDEHIKKREWWIGKKKEVVDKVPQLGITVHDSVASGYSHTKGAFGPQISIDPALQQDLAECHQKVMEHDKYVREYDGWIQVLKANVSARLPLNHDDYLFFFGDDKQVLVDDDE
jgi:hypothetical protein